MKNRQRFLLFSLVWMLAILACSRAFPTQSIPPTPFLPGSSMVIPTSLFTLLPPTRAPETPVQTPTPDQPHEMATHQEVPDTYVIEQGDTLGRIARLYGINVDSLIAANPEINPNNLAIGQVIKIPVIAPQPIGDDFKIIPDSELVDGPFAAIFDTNEFVANAAGYLSAYHEEVNGADISGPQIVDQVAREYSVNPRLLLALLEHQSGWVTSSSPSESTRYYPMGYRQSYWEGLYVQLSWAANSLNMGYYSWRAGAVNHWILLDSNLVPIAPTINAGTAGIQYLFAQLLTRSEWDVAVSSDGLFSTYTNLFGNPFDLSFNDLIPGNLQQPHMQLPFESGDVWSYTSGPHSAWGDGAAWAALDFAPPGEPIGCNISLYWITAVADGLIIRTGWGDVIQDLDGDGLEQTGWTILYMHISSDERVAPGVYVKAGERIGHPSCEGGISNGTHVHIARRYNGEWISADGSLPFQMDGWASQGTGIEYDGYLVKGDQTIVALNRKAAENEIAR